MKIPAKFMTLTVPTPTGHAGYILSYEELDMIIEALVCDAARWGYQERELHAKLIEIRAARF